MFIPPACHSHANMPTGLKIVAAKRYMGGNKKDKKRQYSFSFTFHNVKNYDTKHVLEQYVRPRASRYLCGCEEYPESPGEYHLHLFITYRNARYFEPTIQEYQDFALDELVGEKPDDRVGFYGRVEVSKKYGTYQECKNYLQGLTKDKPVDPEISEFKSAPKEHIKCDVCERIWPWYETQYQYPNERGAGRCNFCAVYKHSSLEAWGFKVRNMDDACEFNKERWTRNRLRLVEGLLRL